MEQQDILNILVIWRGKHLNMEMNAKFTFNEFGHKLQKLTKVKPDTLRLLVPQSRTKRSKLISPFSDENSSLRLIYASILEGKPIRMMGVFDDGVNQVSQATMKSDLRILGFDEEEKRLRQRVSNSLQAPPKLPRGTYIFCDFRPLHLPGVELNPPPSGALRRMHMLACDPGIIAIMNKHRWRVGIMTEMAPVGYVGISPKCPLGFNKNQGEEISLRLRTDDLKGFRKYESIKKTLLHELALMVYSEHDADFFALNKLLNQEAATLDWTKSRSHILSGHRISDHYLEELHIGVSSSSTGQKLGGESNSMASARASSVAAAYSRFLNLSSGKPYPSNNDHISDVAVEPDPDNGELKKVQENIIAEPDPDDTLRVETNVNPSSGSSIDDEEPDPDDCFDNEMMLEPDPDDSEFGDSMMSVGEPDPENSRVFYVAKSFGEPIANYSRFSRVDTTRRNMLKPDPDDAVAAQTMTGKNCEEPDPDDAVAVQTMSVKNCEEPDPDDAVAVQTMSGKNCEEPDPDDSSKVVLNSYSSGANENGKADPKRDDRMTGLNLEVLQRIEEPVASICSRIQRAIKMLRSEVATPGEASSALQTRFKIIRNVIEHPEEAKFRRLRKANPQFQRNVVNYKAALEFLAMVGFCEDVIVGREERNLVLKWNDPGLLWAAKSTLEVSMA